MFRKPFRTPLLKKKEESVHIDEIVEPQSKKRRLSSDNENDLKTIRPRLVFKAPGISSVPRRPLLTIGNSAVIANSSDGTSEGYYNVLWCIHFSNERCGH